MLLRSEFVMLCWRLVVLMLANTDAIKFDHTLQYRQNVPVGTGLSASATPSNSPAAASSAAPPEIPTPSSANSPGPASSSAVITPTTSEQANDSSSPSANIVSQPTSQASNQESTSNVQGSTSVGVPSTTTSPSDPGLTDALSATQIQSRSVTSRTQQFVTTVVTVSSGSTRTNVFTTSGLIPVSTSSATSTSSPSLDTSDNGSSKTGLDSSQKRIVIGVVVGIGGALLLGGMAVVAWRIWGRKGRQNDDDNDLMDSHPGSSGHEKRSSISGQSPFRSTLDQYHNHGGPPNTASNF
ncbi:MAG: hypothetical protein Q9216_004116 [Gyalolechia sp. 2 TL-2023]